MGIPELNVEQLKGKTNGKVLTVESKDYDVARTPWISSADQYPKIIVIVESVSDIVEAVLFASVSGLKIAVKNTGHGVLLPADGSLLTDVSKMNMVKVDEAKQICWVEAGAKWQVILEQVQQAGRAPLMGSSTDIGATRYTIGGSMGWHNDSRSILTLQ